MCASYANLISFLIILVGQSSSIIWAQNPDHLSMHMDFRDTMVYIEASYRSTSMVDRDSVYFLLNPEYELDTIQSTGLKSYGITQKEGIPLPFYRLEFNGNINDTEVLEVAFTYRINLRQQNHMQSHWIELNADKLWFPNLGSFNNLLTYDVSIVNFPKTYRLITHTDAQVTQEKDQLIIRKDTPWYEVLLLAGRAMKEWTYDQDITMIGSEEIADSTFRSIGEKVRHSIDKLNRYFGMSDPITSFVVVLRNTDRKELGFQFNRRNMIITGTDFNDYGNLSHEIVHYWWSKADFIREPWMNESFANFSMYLVLREFDSADYERILANNRKLTQHAIPVAQASLFAPDAYPAYYHKGALHLLSLEEKIGGTTMKQLLSTCVKKNIHTTENFLVGLERLTNAEDRQFFEDLLNL